jgi:hypothetical protein
LKDGFDTIQHVPEGEVSRLKELYNARREKVRFDVEYIPGTNKPPNRIEQLLPLSGETIIGTHSATLSNARIGILERVFFVKNPQSGEYEPPLAPEPGAFRLLHAFRDKVLNRMAPSIPWSRTKVTASYLGAKRRLYEQAHETLKRRDVEVGDALIKIMMKKEKVNISAKKPEDCVQRVVSPRSPVYNLEVATYLKGFEKKVFVAIDNVYCKRTSTVCKGQNAVARGANISKIWASFEDPVAIGLDATRFDQHVSRDALEFEHSFYNLFYKCIFLAMLLSWQLVNKCIFYGTDGIIRFTKIGGRCSGDMNTSLGNILLMCSMVYSIYYRMKRIGKRMRLINDGDDCVLFCERRDEQVMRQMITHNFERFGFRVEIEDTVDELEKIEFCQARPVYSTYYGHHIMVRDPRITCSKDAANVYPTQSDNERNELRTAIGDCGLSLAGDMPVLGAYYSALKRSAPFKKTKIVRAMTGMQFLAMGMEPKRMAPCSESRVSFWKAFGITPDMQKALEGIYDKFVPGSSARKHVDIFTSMTIPLVGGEQ